MPPSLYTVLTQALDLRPCTWKPAVHAELLRPCGGTTTHAPDRLPRAIPPTVNVNALLPPVALNTWIDPTPYVAPLGTVTVIEVSDDIEYDADAPLTTAEVTYVKPEPPNVITVPFGAASGVALVIFGTAPTKNVLYAPEPAAFMTVTVYEPFDTLGTVAVMLESELIVNDAPVLPHSTVLAYWKPEPLRFVLVPTGPAFGDIDEILGAAPS